MRRVGILGGTFDPVHNAHLALALTALESLALDELRWLPAGAPWQKAGRSSAPEHRAAMVQLAIAGEPRFVLERCELDRAGPSYMVDTVRALQQREPGAAWFLIVGQDQYANLHNWHHWADLLARVTLAVAARPQAPPQADAALRDHPYQVLPLPPMAIDATSVRARVARGEPIAHLVPPAVARYIDQHALYQSGRADNGN